MSIGYACLTVGVPNTEMKSCIMKNANDENLIRLIEHNLNSLASIIDYNIRNDIKLFRISSDIIPFGSSPANKLHWWETFDHRLKTIGRKILENGMRVSMHPGQYTVINSTNEDVVDRAIEDLKYHDRFLNSLGVGAAHKIILHIGGIYHDKGEAIQRFADNYERLQPSIKRRLVIENDEKLFDICDVLKIGKDLNIPVVYDNLHNAVNPFDNIKTDSYWIERCKHTWRPVDGLQKVHYSQQNPSKKSGAHADSIGINSFLKFYNEVGRKDLDIMLEVKDKNISAIKCINCTQPDLKGNRLEIEWARYKYKILENSQESYLGIRKIFREKHNHSALLFYNLIEEALMINPNTGSSINAAQHVWGYFKNQANEKEKNAFISYIEKMENNEKSRAVVKRFLQRMAIKYERDYLMDSYYFVY